MLHRIKKTQLAVQHGIAQVNVEQACPSVLLTELEQVTHETYYLREVLYRARVKYTGINAFCFRTLWALLPMLSKTSTLFTAAIKTVAK